VSTSKNKRKFPRSLIDLTVHVNIGTEVIPAKILDITVEGISLELGSRVKVGDRVTISIDDSQWIRKNELSAEVVRCDLSEPASSKCIIAAKFIEPNDEYLMDALALVHGRQTN
jgi:hypothetical protein